MINYVKGDATLPQGEGTKIIAHVCNNRGVWGAGFVMALSARNKEPEQVYKRWYALRHYALWYPTKFGVPFRLGEVRLASFGPRVFVANMIAQEGFGEWEGEREGGLRTWKPPIRYMYLATCLIKLRKQAREFQASVHMPRIGCGLAGGEWNIVGPMVDHLVAKHGVPVTVYDL